VAPADLDLRDHPDGAVLGVRVVPRAGRSAVAGVREGALARCGTLRY